MTSKEAADYLRPIMENASLPNYQAALALAVEALEGRAMVHGMWAESDIPGSMLSKCTVCGFRCGAYTFNFCPNCGAKMDKADR